MFGAVLRNIADVVVEKRSRVREFGLNGKALLREAMELGRAREGLPEAEFVEKAEDVRRRVTLLLGLGKQNDERFLLRFLSPPYVEPTNNRAERMRRPAVIARKVSHYLTNQAGADAFATFASLAQTARKNGTGSVTEAVRQLF